MDRKARPRTMLACSRRVRGRKMRERICYSVRGCMGWTAPARQSRASESLDRRPQSIMTNVVLSWMDRYLKGIENGVEREKPVRYFVMGANQWRDSDVWPPPGRRTQFFLAPAGKWRASRQPGCETCWRRESFSEFVSDPANPVVNEYESSGAHDYRKLAERADVLTFDSPVMEKDMEVTGPIYGAHVCVVRVSRPGLVGTPSGCLSGWDGIELDESRAGRFASQLSRSGSWTSVAGARAKSMNSTLLSLITSNVFLKGHRVRVQISGSFYPNFSRNLQSGKSEVDSAEMKKSWDPGVSRR